MAIKTQFEERIWYPDKFAPSKLKHSRITDMELSQLVREHSEFEAHNAWFEKCIWENILEKRYGILKPPDDQWRCTSALAAQYALPRSLEKVIKALGLPIEKDMAGNRLCKAMCKPRKPLKADLQIYGSEELCPVLWKEKPEDFTKLIDYCIQDVRAEWELSEFLPPLPDKEREVYILDQRINKRGVYIDIKGIDDLRNAIEQQKQQISDDFQRMVGFDPSQVIQLKDWLCSMGYHTTSVAADVLSNMSISNEFVQQVVDMRLEFAKSSVSKLETMVRKRGPDGRVRENFRYHIASTGRWGGSGVQMQNLPRSDHEIVDTILRAAPYGADALRLIMGREPLDLAKECIRGVLIAAPGKVFTCADLSAIEGRVREWLSGGKEFLQAYREGKDIYKITAQPVYHKDYEDITKSERQIGKVCELALGYQGWKGAFNSMASSYGVSIPEEDQVPILQAWRNSHPDTVRMWYSLERCWVNAYNSPGEIVRYGKLAFRFWDKFMRIRLPSGRVLYYYDPRVEKTIDRWGKPKNLLSYMTVDSMRSYKWVRCFTYGGKLVENVTQAVSRDIFVEGMINVENAGYQVVIHVHDELVSENDIGFGSLEEFCELMCKQPEWALDLPLAAGGWVGKRYRKD